MDLILWRHAEAFEGDDPAADLDRALTRRGEKQAQRIGVWLDARLPETARVLVSPARRTEQTALALGRRYRLCPELSPTGSADDLLALAHWPLSRQATLVIGHQPTLGRVIAGLLGMGAGDCAVKKGAVWWLRAREREGVLQTVVVTVQVPDLL